MLSTIGDAEKYLKDWLERKGKDTSNFQVGDNKHVDGVWKLWLNPPTGGLFILYPNGRVVDNYGTLGPANCCYTGDGSLYQEYLDVAEQAVYLNGTNEFICYSEDRLSRNGYHIWVYVDGIYTEVDPETGL